MEKLKIIRTSELKNSDDGWSYMIKIYEDVTDISMIDHRDKKEEYIGQLSAGYDILICEEIIRLRKQSQEEK